MDSARHGHRAGAAKVPEFLVCCAELGIGMVTLSLLTNCFTEINWAPIGAIANQIADETLLSPLRKLGKL